jgi:hypothetical protein
MVTLQLRYDASNHYWQIEGETKIYSSATNTLIQTTDQNYQDWLTIGNVASPIPNEVELWGALQAAVPWQFPEWLFNGTTFIQPAVNNYTPAQIKSYAAMVRYNKETGGINFTPPSGPSQGIKLLIDTSRASVVNINNATLTAQQNPSYTTQWKTRDGAFHPVDATTMIAMNANVQKHVALCFSTELTCQSYTTTTAVDDAFSAISIEYTS